MGLDGIDFLEDSETLGRLAVVVFLKIIGKNFPDLLLGVWLGHYDGLFGEFGK